MTPEYPYSLAQLAQILSALENERRNPNTKRNAIKAIERAATQIGLTAADVFDAADGLLSGRLSAAEFRAALRDEGCEPATFVAEPPAEPAANDAPAEAYIMPNAGPLAVTPRRRVGSRPDSKQTRMIAMLKRPEGATVEQIAEATGWQQHTCRSAMAGALKKKLGLTITSEKVDGARVYRIAE
jgi:DNA-directed RNA polymerase specialized sigma24 family protein